MSGITIEEQDLIAGIKGMLSPETWESIGNIKVKRKRKAPRQEASQEPLIEQSITEIIPEKIEPPVSETKEP